MAAVSFTTGGVVKNTTWLLIALVILAGIAIRTMPHIGPVGIYTQTLVCSENQGDERIVVEHAYIRREEGVYIIEDKYGKTSTYDKDAFQWCIVGGSDSLTKAMDK